MKELMLKHELIKDVIIAIETGLLYIFVPLTNGGHVVPAGLFLMIMTLLILRDIDVVYFKKLKKRNRA